MSVGEVLLLIVIVAMMVSREIAMWIERRRWQHEAEETRAFLSREFLDYQKQLTQERRADLQGVMAEYGVFNEKLKGQLDELWAVLMGGDFYKTIIQGRNLTRSQDTQERAAAKDRPLDVNVFNPHGQTIEEEEMGGSMIYDEREGTLPADVATALDRMEKISAVPK